jgi:hypothetical protein
MNKRPVLFLLLFILSVLAIGLWFTSNIFEGLDVNQTQVISQNKDGSYTVPQGYYVISTDTSKQQQTISKIPFGYAVDSNGNLFPKTTATIYSTSQTPRDSDWSKTTVTDSSYSKQTRFSADNTDIQYHPDIPTENTSDSLAQTGTWIIDSSGNKVLMPWSSVTDSITYYQPGSYTFGASNYVPNYETSVLLSKTTQMSQASPIVYNTAEMKGGFCQRYKDYPDKLEQICKTLDVNTCGSTSCCVLMGGSKCVAGDKRGPTFRTNYSDVFLRNKETYYHAGTCYGNCI